LSRPSGTRSRPFFNEHFKGVVVPMPTLEHIKKLVCKGAVVEFIEKIEKLVCKVAVVVFIKNEVTTNKFSEKEATVEVCQLIK